MKLNRNQFVKKAILAGTGILLFSKDLLARVRQMAFPQIRALNSSLSIDDSTLTGLEALKRSIDPDLGPDDDFDATPIVIKNPAETLWQGKAGVINDVLDGLGIEFDKEQLQIAIDDYKKRSKESYSYEQVERKLVYVPNAVKPQ